MSLSLKIALRFLKSSKAQTLMIAIGIAVGVSVQIFIGLLIQSLQNDLIDSTIGNSPHITIRSNIKNENIASYDNIINKINSNTASFEETTTLKSIVPVLDTPILLNFDDDTKSLLYRGIGNLQDKNFYKLDERLAEGSLPKEENELMLGITLKNEYNLKLNDEISIISASGDLKTLKVVGFFDFKVASLNNNWAISSIKNVQSLLDAEDEASSVEIQIADIFTSDIIEANLIDILKDEKIKSENWQTTNEDLLSGLNGQSVSSNMIQVFVLIAVMLGIASVLAITVIQKSKQIGILKAMGIKDKASSRIFLYQGLILGISGAVLGTGLGASLILMFKTFAKNPDGTPVINIEFNTGFIIFSMCIAIISSGLASLIPAIKSSKLNPIEVIRNG
jgi:lipoprotein-releasing system permease protein